MSRGFSWRVCSKKMASMRNFAKLFRGNNAFTKGNKYIFHSMCHGSNKYHKQVMIFEWHRCRLPYFNAWNVAWKFCFYVTSFFCSHHSIKQLNTVVLHLNWFQTYCVAFTRCNIALFGAWHLPCIGHREHWWYYNPDSTALTQLR